MFSTERLILRATRPSDDEDMLKLYNDERVAPWITEGYLVPKQPGYMEKIRTFVDSSLLFVVLEEKETGAFVDATGFVHQPEPKNRNAVIFIALTQAHWSKGYGFEAMNFLIDYAFHSMNQHRVSLTVFEGNDRAIDLYHRLGFVEEGRHRKIVWMNGAWRGTYYMGILEDEWAERRKTHVTSKGKT